MTDFPYWLYIRKGMGMYKSVISPLLDRFDSEATHVRVRDMFGKMSRNRVGLRALEYLSHGGARFSDPRLRVDIGNADVGALNLNNPLMVGAGWDKIGCTVPVWPHLGFAGITVGTVLPHSQPGNDKPRQFMVAPGVCINALGFNSPGMRVVRDNLDRSTPEECVVGISVGRNRETPNARAADAHAMVIEKLYERADYFEHNVSSPNTPGLRQLQDKELLADIIQAGNDVMDHMGAQKPVFIKASPDLTPTAAMEMVRVVIDNKATGVIIGNTTNDPRIKGRYGEKWENIGGLSGNDQAFRNLSTQLIRHVYRETLGTLPIIGAGGVKDVRTALEKIMAGASAVQIVTALRGEGLSVASRINRGFVRFLEQEGVDALSDLVGLDCE